MRTNAGPMRTGVRVAYPPTGCPTRRPSPARWCSYAYCRSLHITSFRSAKPYPMVNASARTPRYGPPSGTRASARNTAMATSMTGSLPGIPDRRDVDVDVGIDTHVVDPALARGQPAGDRQPERATLTRRAPAIAGPCPCRTSARRRSWRARCPGAPRRRSRSRRPCRGRSGRRPRSTGRRPRPPGSPRSRSASRRESCSQKIGPDPMNWLATTRAAVT